MLRHPVRFLCISHPPVFICIRRDSRCVALVLVNFEFRHTKGTTWVVHIGKTKSGFPQSIPENNVRKENRNYSLPPYRIQNMFYPFCSKNCILGKYERGMLPIYDAVEI